VNKEPSGVLVVNKHGGVTSHDIVYKIRKLYGTARVGHTGTLDPMATGVLAMLVGRAAKAAEYLVSDTKRYRARLRLGIRTDTEDTTGAVLSSCEEIPSEERVREVCSAFVGRIKQIPPMYSALKVDGKKLCDLARQGVTVEREAREIEIFSLEVTPTEERESYILDVFCSSGTYIRTLCADIGEALGCGGAMAALERRAAGEFTIEQSVTVDELSEMTLEERVERLLPTESLFEPLRKVRLVPFYERLCRNGCEIYLRKIGVSAEEGERVSLYGEKGFFALGEVRSYTDGKAIKMIKLFEL